MTKTIEERIHELEYRVKILEEYNEQTSTELSARGWHLFKRIWNRVRGKSNDTNGH